MKKLRYYWFCIRWLFTNQQWDSTRQKYKALDIAAAKHMAAKERRKEAHP